MPRGLLERFRPESIEEFRAAAHMRFDDGLAAAAQGRRTGAIYLWGYAAEMTLKAAYFSRIGFTPFQPITMSDLQAAKNAGQILGVPWPNAGAGHNVRAWADFLVMTRTQSLGNVAVALNADIQRCGQRIGQVWKETIRYHKNVAYLYELKRVHEAAAWLIVHSKAL